MSLLWEAYNYVISEPFDWRYAEKEVTEKINAMSNYEFLEMLETIFDQAVKDAAQ